MLSPAFIPPTLEEDGCLEKASGARVEELYSRQVDDWIETGLVPLVNG